MRFIRFCCSPPESVGERKREGGPPAQRQLTMLRAACLLALGAGASAAVAHSEYCGDSIANNYNPTPTYGERHAVRRAHDAALRESLFAWDRLRPLCACAHEGQGGQTAPRSRAPLRSGPTSSFILLHTTASCLPRHEHQLSTPAAATHRRVTALARALCSPRRPPQATPIPAPLLTFPAFPYLSPPRRLAGSVDLHVHLLGMHGSKR